MSPEEDTQRANGKGFDWTGHISAHFHISYCQNSASPEIWPNNNRHVSVMKSSSLYYLHYVLFHPHLCPYFETASIGWVLGGSNIVIKSILFNELNLRCNHVFIGPLMLLTA